METYAVLGAGRYGDVRVPLEVRAIAAQATLSLVSLMTLSISALFAGQRSAEARLRASERRLALIADAAPGVIFSLERSPDGQLRLPFVSTTSAELLGIESERLGGDPEALLGRLEASDREALLAALAEPSGERGLIHLELPLRKPEGREMWLEVSARSNREADGRITWHGFIQDVTARRRLVEELNHRTRNLLTVVQAVAEHTARGTPPRELADKLGERLAGLAASHQLLAARGWEGVEMEPLVTSQLAHLESLFGSRLLIEGPPLTLRPQAAQIIGMAVHELATNACKHGALSQQGTVRLSWITPGDDPSDRFRMSWEESGGPPFAATGRRGFGHKVIVDMATYQLAADVNLTPRPDGLTWHLDAPRERVVLERKETKS
jgi:PAS domain S-box-containing protein